MKFPTPSPQPKPKNRTVTAKSTTDNKVDFFKWVGLAISLIGIGAWMAGEAYIRGYWGVAGNAGPIVSPTLQQTAWFGFLGPIQYWFWATGLIAIAGIFVLFLAVESKKERKPGRIARAVDGFFQDRLKINGDVAGFGFAIFILAVGIAYLAFCLRLWLILSYDAGKENFERTACHARATKNCPTVIFLADGKKISGKFLDQTEKSAILLDQTSVYKITLGEKSQIVSSTTTADIKCPTN